MPYSQGRLATQTLISYTLRELLAHRQNLKRRILIYIASLFTNTNENGSGFGQLILEIACC